MGFFVIEMGAKSLCQLAKAVGYLGKVGRIHPYERQRNLIYQAPKFVMLPVEAGDDFCIQSLLEKNGKEQGSLAVVVGVKVLGVLAASPDESLDDAGGEVGRFIIPLAN